MSETIDSPHAPPDVVPLQVAGWPARAEVVEALERMLVDARSGRLQGFAVAELRAGVGYQVSLVGRATEEHIGTLGMLEELKFLVLRNLEKDR